ncbi:MAG TPA: hypothetical protein VHD83_25570 [Puia sp.]|nr:hypothetical protein [Puia sp.]
MKSLDFSTMENIQGGIVGNLNINIPLTGLLSTMGLGSLLGAGLGLGLGISYNLELPALPSLPLGL